MSISYVPWNQPAAITDRVCLRDGDSELSYDDVAHRTEAVAERFAALGVRRGDVVAIMLPNCAELLLGLLAAWHLGAAATPVNPAFTANEAAYQVQDSGAVLLLTSAADADYGVPVVLAKDLPAESAGVLPGPATGVDDLALLIYTSGSTGRPKGVMLDHSNIGATAESSPAGPTMTARDPLPAGAAAVPRERDHGQRRVPAAGRRLDVHRRAVPRGQFLGTVERSRPTFFAAVPTIYALLAPGRARSRTPASLRFVICGAAPMPRQLIGEFEERFGVPVVEGYGLSEVHGGLHAEPGATACARRAASGCRCPAATSAR